MELEEIIHSVDSTDSDEEHISYVMRNRWYDDAEPQHVKRRNRFMRVGIVVLVLAFFFVGHMALTSYREENAQIIHDQVNNSHSTINATDRTQSIIMPPDGYSVWSGQCRIAHVDPFADEFEPLYKIMPSHNCSSADPMVQKTFDNRTGRYSLHTVKASKRLRHDKHATDEIRCCYQSIEPDHNGNFPETGYSQIPCVSLPQNFLVPDRLDGVILRCYSVPNRMPVYADAHFFIQERKDVRRRYQVNGEGFPFSILMFGIDSVSATNFQRAMPLTYEHLMQHDWYDFLGYNKVENSTFYNMMTLLTGMNSVEFNEWCPADEMGSLDNCTMIWRAFAENGYATAFAEDNTYRGTFNMARRGFKKPPTDYYGRPFMLAIEQNLYIHYYDNKPICIGSLRPVEYVFDFGMEFASRFDNDRAFGVFYTSASSRYDYRGPNSIDARMHAYLEELEERGILDRSVVILFSDQGQRRGPLHEMPYGGLEERLPMLFIWLPTWMRESYPEFVVAMQANKHRLISSFDLYLTLYHLMAVSTGNAMIEYDALASSCPTCQSLLRPAEADRSCRNAGVDPQACACDGFRRMPEGLAQNLTKIVVTDMNNYLAKYNYTDRCEHLVYREVIEAASRIDNVNKNIGHKCRISFAVEQDDAEFEATFNYDVRDGNLIMNMDDIKRLTMMRSGDTGITDTLARHLCVFKN